MGCQNPPYSESTGAVGFVTGLRHRQLHQMWQQIQQSFVMQIASAVRSKLPDGMANPDWVLAEAEKDNERNPSTELHFLLRHFEALGKPATA